MLINLPSLAKFVKNEVGQSAINVCKGLTDEITKGKSIGYSELCNELSQKLYKLGYSNIADSVLRWVSIFETETQKIPDGSHQVQWVN